MKKIETLKQLQSSETFILKELYKVCDDNNLKLYLLGGTLIGAIRHKGFVPWDDDIDVCISRPDYNKLLEITGGKIGKYCSIIDPASSPDFRGYIPLCVFDNSRLTSKQFRGNEPLKLSVSIFVYDGAPKSKKEQKKYYKKMYILRAKHALCRADFRHVNTKKAKIFGPFLSLFYSTKKVFHYKKLILKEQQKYSFSDSEYVSTNADNSSIKEVALKEDFEKYYEVSFEGIKVKIFSHYDSHLRNYYGDYMKLPPENQRIQKHSFEAEISDNFDFDWAIAK